MSDPVPMTWTLTRILEALGMETPAGPDRAGLTFRSVSTDSRTIEPDQLFVALSGETFDGHAFVPGVLGRGVRGAVVRRDRREGIVSSLGPKASEAVLFPVEDTLKALGDMARNQRLVSGAKVAAVTGSAGKTSTREMISSIFGTRFTTLTTRKNFNNEIGLPLTLLALSRSHEWAVVEMGMNHAGEIGRLAAIALPDIAVVTNTAECHLEGLGSVEAVAGAKAEIFSGLTPGGTGIVNLDDPRYSILAAGAAANPEIGRIIRFGTGPEADVTARDVTCSEGKTRFVLEIRDREAVPVVLDTPAPFMVSNALAAASAALAAGIGPDGIRAGLEAFRPFSGRMAIMELGQGIRVINDTYNANPKSMAGALETLGILAGQGKGIAVLGDMLELGGASAELHRQMGRTAVQYGVSSLLVFGDMGQRILEGALEAGLAPDRSMAGTKAGILERLTKEVRPGSWILVKGSRGMRMEEIVQGLEKAMAEQ